MADATRQDDRRPALDRGRAVQLRRHLPLLLPRFRRWRRPAAQSREPQYPGVVREDGRPPERQGVTAMARVPYLEPGDLAPEDRALLARPIALFKALVNSPNAARAFSALGGFIRNKSRLDPRLRELAILQVGWLARAPYEWSHHVKIGREFGVSDDDIRALIADTEGRPVTLDQPALLVLRAAREMTSSGEASAEVMAALARHLSPELLVDLVITIAFYNAVVRVLATLQIEVEHEYEVYLREFPLPEPAA